MTWTLINEGMTLTKSFYILGDVFKDWHFYFRSKPHPNSSRHSLSKENRRSLHETTNRSTNNHLQNNGNGNAVSKIAKMTQPAGAENARPEQTRDLVNAVLSPKHRIQWLLVIFKIIVLKIM